MQGEPSSNQGAQQQAEASSDQAEQQQEQPPSDQAEQASDSAEPEGQLHRRVQQLVRRLRNREVPAEELQPALTAWKNRAAELVAAVGRALSALGSISSPAGAAERDAELLEAVLACLQPEEQQRRVVQATLQATRTFGRDGVAPQAVLLISNEDNKYAAAATPLASGDPELQQPLEYIQREFQMFLARMSPQQHRASLPDRSDVPLQAIELQTAAPQARKPLPPSEQARQQMKVLWHWLQPFLTDGEAFSRLLLWMLRRELSY